MSEVFKQFFQRRNKKSSPESSIEDLSLEKSKTNSGYDINGNGRSDISDGQINELAQTLGWSPDRLRELLNSNEVDFASLKTIAHSTNTGFDVNGNGQTDITFSEVDQLANSSGFEATDSGSSSFTGAGDAASLHAFAASGGASSSASTSASLSTTTSSSASLEPIKMPSLAANHNNLREQAAAEAPAAQTTSSSKPKLPARGLFKNKIDSAQASNASLHSSKAVNSTAGAHFRVSSLKTFFDSQQFDVFAADPKFFKKTKWKGPLPKLIAAIFKLLTGGLLYFFGFRKSFNDTRTKKINQIKKNHR